MSRLKQLSAIIAENTKKIDDFLSSNSLPAPSFDIDAPLRLQLSKDIEIARTTVLEASIELRELLTGPVELILGNSPSQLSSLHAIYHHQIAKTVPVGSEATFGEIAEKCGLNEADVRRILRHAMAHRIFCEPRKGVVAHTALSKVLAESKEVDAWVGACTEEMWPAAVNMVPAMKRWPNSQEPNEVGFSLANNTHDSIYAEMGKDPKRAGRFSLAMSAFAKSEGYEPNHVVNHGLWASIPGGTIVDVGGAHGDVMLAIAEEFPSLRFVVQDMPSVVETTPKPPAHLKDRVTFMAHDFLTPQPVKNADVYYFRWIFHNWSDKYCVIILRNLIPALKPGARIVINDGLLPEPNTLNLLKERNIRQMDLAMLHIQNSREREEQDWADLFRTADPGFKFLGVKQPEGSNLAFIEATWQPAEETV